ncbi:MAG TPA: trehalase family glycosidase, partial [Stenomitos sp.]
MNTAIALPQTDRLQAVRRYIKQTWQTLYRSHQHLVEAARDPKLEHPQDQPYVVYVPPHEDQGTIKLMLTQTLSAQEWRQIDLRVFPADPELIETHGLLYLPHPYIVPGGRFNEMYGWDSYFIQLGLLREGELSLAQNMVEQLLYEVEHYGTVLNANRTYMLSRSQPPVLTLMILALFEQTQDQAWLSSTLPMAERYYYYWTVPPHLNQATGLSRYFALGDGPSPEVLASEQDEQGRTHYERAKAYYRENPVTEYDLALYYNHEQDCLTDLFYKGDRS